MSKRRLVLLVACAALVAPGVTTLATAAPPVPAFDPTVLPARDTEPVIVTGNALGNWAVPHDAPVKAPFTDLWCHAEANGFPDTPLTLGGQCGHSHYEKPEVEPTYQEGLPLDKITGWKWDGTTFVEIPLQIDEVWTRYLDNSESGFAFYSGNDQHTTYAYDGNGDREGFRYTKNAPGSCTAVEDPNHPGVGKSDPVQGLDTNDEIVFMASDVGTDGSGATIWPVDVSQMRGIEVLDPARPEAGTGWVYVGVGRAPSFNANNGYVRYERDANADTFAYSQSSYGNYGNAPKGEYCDANGNIVLRSNGSPDIQQRRPRDTATITTDRYKFRYDGRWLMSGINISPDNGVTYGPDLVDRWKARAFAQDPGSETPCCGYEDEDVNWGGSSILLGERSGPVRTIRETWGADSGTNVIRRETFYRGEMRQKTWLRVHPIPPVDGIYAQWDHNAGVVTKFITPRLPDGVPVDGVNDEVMGNFDDPCNPRWDDNGRSEIDTEYRNLAGSTPICEQNYHPSVDAGDPSQFDPNVALNWTEITGPYGTIVSRFQVYPQDITPGGAVQQTLALPYYRDDACFDDGTGLNPGPHLRPRGDEGPYGGRNTLFTVEGYPRQCWTPADGPTTDGDERFLQGSIGTYGLHLLTVVESDNARLTVPVTQIVAEQRMVMLPGEGDWETGERYGRGFERPLLTTQFQRPGVG